MITLKVYIKCAFACVIVAGCSKSSDPEPAFDCNLSLLTISVSSTVPTSGCAASDGSIVLTTTGGEGGVLFSINGGSFQTSPTFTALAAGQYSIVARDENNCEKSVVAMVGAEGSDLSINNISNQFSGCGDNKGAITVEATGSGNLMYSLNDGSFQTSNVFSGLTAGDYTVTLTDDSSCEISGPVKVLNGTSYQQQIKSIITANCAISGCHDGTNGANINWNQFSNVKDKAQSIKNRTQNGSMPPDGRTITANEKALIACWVDDGALNN